MQHTKIKLLLLLFVLFLTGCTSAQTDLQQITAPDLNRTTKIIFINSSSGERVVTEDLLKIREFTSYLKDFVLQESSNTDQELSPLWEVQFYKNGELAAQLMFQTPLYIDGTYYDILEPELDMAAIERFIANLPQE